MVSSDHHAAIVTTLINDLRELDSAERSARHNDYQQSVAQLHSISDELDRLNSSLIHPLN